MEIAWKIIAGIAALFLLVAGIFGFQSKDAIKKEQALLDTAKGLEKKANKTEGDAIEYEKAQVGYFNQYETDRDQYKEETAEAEAETGELKAATANMQAESDELGRQIADIQKILDDFGDIDQLLAKVSKLTSDVANTKATLANRQQHNDLLTNNIAGTKEEVQGYRELVGRQNLGELAAEWSSNVTAYNPEWNFVVLSRGNLGATYPNALVDIERGGTVIGQARISNVEQNRSAATIVADSFAAGVAPRAGDRVVPHSKAMEAGEGLDLGPDNTAAGPGESLILAPPAGGAPDDDPFGAMGGGEPVAPAGDDPFGAMDGTGEAAPAPAGDDPFGAPVNPAGASPDPFANP